jgi:hypothetical protein
MFWGRFFGLLEVSVLSFVLFLDREHKEKFSLV